jgi:hypothetical protein
MHDGDVPLIPLHRAALNGSVASSRPPPRTMPLAPALDGRHRWWPRIRRRGGHNQRLPGAPWRLPDA